MRVPHGRRTPPVQFPEKTNMSTLTGEDVLATAKRAGWSVSPARAGEIAAAANSRITSFDKLRAQLTFDEDAAGFMTTLIALRQEESK
jgi:hypothetical protein